MEGPEAAAATAAPPPSPEQVSHLHSHGGFVLPGYEAVRDQFLLGFEHDGQENSAQLCITVRGRTVVDLWASRSNERCEVAMCRVCKLVVAESDVGCRWPEHLPAPAANRRVFAPMPLFVIN